MLIGFLPFCCLCTALLLPVYLFKGIITFDWIDNYIDIMIMDKIQDTTDSY